MAQYQSAAYLAESVLLERPDIPMASHKQPGAVAELAYWIGWFACYWNVLEGDDYRSIHRAAPFETLYQGWEYLHTVAPELAIEELKEAAGDR